MAGKSGGVSDPLFSPYRLKHLTLKNRIISTAHEPAYTENGRAGEPNKSSRGSHRIPREN